MRITSLFIAVHILFIIFPCQAQIPVGLTYDVNGYPFDGYYDPFTYNPTLKLTITHNSDTFEPGYYYDVNGNKIKGYIKFQNEKIWFKPNKNGVSKRITLEDTRNLVVGVDSFFVISNFFYGNKFSKEPEFAQYIATVNGKTFVKHFHFTSGMSQQYGSKPPIIESYLYKEEDWSNWLSFYGNDDFSKNAHSCFSQVPLLSQRISNGRYKKEDIESLIKMGEYYEKFITKTPIYYDKYWQDVDQISDAKYHAKIESIVDSIWTINYFEDSLLLNTVSYSSIYPNFKNGDFTAYYPNGEIRQSIFYKNNVPISVQNFNEAGQLISAYKYIEKKDEDNETYYDLNYSYFADSLGQNVIGGNLPNRTTLRDTLSNQLVYFSFKDAKIDMVYKLNQTDTIFLFTQSNYKYKLQGIQNQLNMFVQGENYDNALTENAQGTVLLWLKIDKTGSITKYKVLNCIHEDINKLVTDCIKTYYLPGNEGNYSLKPYKRNKTKQRCEMIIPVEFSINRFYRKPAAYNNFNHMNWMMHQQMMMNLNSAPKFKPPVYAMPRGF